MSSETLRGYLESARRMVDRIEQRAWAEGRTTEDMTDEEGDLYMSALALEKHLVEKVRAEEGLGPYEPV